MMYISSHPEVFKGLKITDIKAVNPWDGTELRALNSKLIRSFNELVKDNPNCGVKKIDGTLFLDDPASLVEQAKGHLEALESEIENGGEGRNDNFYTKE